MDSCVPIGRFPTDSNVYLATRQGALPSLAYAASRIRGIRTHAAVREVPFAEQLVNESGRIDSTRSRGGLLAGEREREEGGEMEKEKREKSWGLVVFSTA